MKHLDVKTEKMRIISNENRLTSNEMENIMAGKMNWSAFCDGVAIAALLSFGANPILDGAGVACLAYSIATR